MSSPFEVAARGNEQLRTLRVVRIVRLIKLARLSRLARMGDTLAIKSQYIVLMKFALLMIFLMHWVTTCRAPRVRPASGSTVVTHWSDWSRHHRLLTTCHHHHNCRHLCDRSRARTACSRSSRETPTRRAGSTTTGFSLTARSRDTSTPSSSPSSPW